jgi:hypothetical protein
MPTQRNSLVQSIRLTGNGITVCLRVERGRPQDLEDFLRENDLTDRIDFEGRPPLQAIRDDREKTTQLSAA